VLLAIGNIVQFIYSNDYFITSTKIARLEEKLGDALSKPISSWEDFDKRIEIAKELVGFDKRQYLFNIIKMAHDFHPEKFNNRLADLVVDSNDPRVIVFFDELVNKSFASGNIDSVIVYAPYIYQQKQPDKVLSFFAKLAEVNPDWKMEKAFPEFNADKFINNASIKKIDDITVKDYANALKETPSDYAKMLQGKK